MTAIVGLVALSGCTATSQGTPVRASGQSDTAPDVSKAGRLDYACALAVDAKTNHGPVDSWNIAVGDEADPVLHEVAGATGLLGALSGAHVAGHEDLSDAAADYYKGTATFNIDLIQRSVDEIATGCDQDDLPVHQPDVSAGGRVDYACALAEDVATNGGPVKDWLRIGDHAGPAAYELGGAVGLLGAQTASHLKGHRGLSDAATDILAGMSRMQVDTVRRGLDDLTERCAAR